MTPGAPIEGWDHLLSSIGAIPSIWTHSPAHEEELPSWKVELTTAGIDVALSDIDVDYGTGLYLYHGQQILIYIRDTRQQQDVLLFNKAQARRFHFMDCDKIQEMKADNRFQRYVAIARTDGRFPVVSTEQDGAHHELEAQLGPCKLCLKQIGYGGYAGARVGIKKRIWEEFDIPTFFADYASMISNVPPGACPGVLPDDYGDDWAQHSHEVRRAARWRCDECNVDLSKARQCLHVHHINGVKRDVSLANLRPLCVVCHAEQPGHGRMHVGRRCRETIERLRK